MTIQNGQLWKPDEASAYLNVSRTTLYQLVADGVLPVIRVGRSLRFDPDAIRAWAKSREENASGGSEQ